VPSFRETLINPATPIFHHKGANGTEKHNVFFREVPCAPWLNMRVWNSRRALFFRPDLKDALNPVTIVVF
jgi:hypothetical protein